MQKLYVYKRCVGYKSTFQRTEWKTQSVSSELLLLVSVTTMHCCRLRLMFWRGRCAGSWKTI